MRRSLQQGPQPPLLDHALLRRPLQWAPGALKDSVNDAAQPPSSEEPLAAGVKWEPSDRVRRLWQTAQVRRSGCSGRLLLLIFEFLQPPPS